MLARRTAGSACFHLDCGTELVEDTDGGRACRWEAQMIRRRRLHLAQALKDAGDPGTGRGRGRPDAAWDRPDSPEPGPAASPPPAATLIYSCRFMDTRQRASTLYRLLGDEARLRLLAGAGPRRLNVTELTGILGLAQSGVSRHLGLAQGRRPGRGGARRGFAYYRLSPALRAERRRRRSGRCCGAVRRGGRQPRRPRRRRAAAGSAARSGKENFDAHGGPDTRDGASARARPQLGGVVARARPAAAAARRRRHRLRRGLPDDRSGPLGAARDRGRSVRGRADAGRALATRRRVTNITWKRGELEKLPLADGSVDVALLSQALHHAADPARAIAEAARVAAARRARARARPARTTTRTGCATSSAIAGSASTTPTSRLCRRRRRRRHGQRRRPRRRRSVHRLDCQRHEARRPRVQGRGTRRKAYRCTLDSSIDYDRALLKPADRTHPRPRRRHGHHDPAPRADEARLPRRPLPRPRRAT